MSRINWYVKEDGDSRVVSRLLIPGLDFATEEAKAIDDLIAFILKHKNEITQVELQHTNLSACSREHLERLTAALAALPNLQKIDLSGNDLCTAACEMGRALASCSKLDTIILQRAISGSDVLRQKELLTQFLGIPSLVSLDCSHCDFSLLDAEKMIAIGETLKAARNLKSLALRDTSLAMMESEAFASLADALRSLDLVALDLSNNQFFPDETTVTKLESKQVRCFFLQLSQSTKLQVLKLAATGLGYWDDKELTEFFKNLQAVARASLDISFNELEMGPWVVELAALIRQVSFKALSIKTNSLDDTGIEILEDAIKSNTAFEKLEASGNRCEVDILNRLKTSLAERSAARAGRVVIPVDTAAAGAGAGAALEVDSDEMCKSDEKHKLDEERLPPWTLKH